MRGSASNTHYGISNFETGNAAEGGWLLIQRKAQWRRLKIYEQRRKR